MNINLVIITEKTPAFYNAARKEYEKRLGRFCRLKTVCVKSAEKAAKAVNPKYPVITVDEKGSALSSEALAEKIAAAETGGISAVNIVVGGGYVPGEDLIDGGRLSVTQFGLSPDLVAVTVTEQIYRAYKIISGETYHK